MTEGSEKPTPKKGSRTAKSSRKSQSRSKSSAKPSSPAAAEAQRATGTDASRLIDERIRSLNDWRGKTLADVRQIILNADPEITEEWKWRGTPVWSRSGNICTGETYKQVVKLTFAQGASLPDPRGLFNSSLEGNTRRAIDIREGDIIDKTALSVLIQDAVKLNQQSKISRSKSVKKAPSAARTTTNAAQSATGMKTAKNVPLLTGGNPQIAKGDGDAPVQTYIAAMPGWKHQIGKRVDALIVKNVPNVQKAIKWNSPFYGVPGQGWFLSFHVFTHYVKVTFFKGIDLLPIPPGATERSKEARWLDIREQDEIDEALVSEWIRQAAAVPGWVP